MIFGQRAALPVNLTRKPIERIHLLIRIGEDEPLRVGLSRYVAGVAPLQGFRGLIRRLRPVDRALVLEDVQRRAKFPVMHQIESALLVGVLHTLHRVKLGRLVNGAQRLEHATTLDAGKLAVVAGNDHLGARQLGFAEHPGQVLGRQHRGLVHDQNVPAGPHLRTGLKPLHFRSDRARMRKAVLPHVLDDAVGPRHADDPVSVRLVGLADGAERPALAGAGLPRDDREPRRPRGMAQGLRLLLIQAARVAIGAGHLDAMPGMRRQGRGVPQHGALGVEDRLRGVVGHRVRRRLAQPDHLRAA
jgi:hypothetical protein